MDKVKVTVKQLKTWIKKAPQGMMISYVSGKGKDYSWGSGLDKSLYEELALMTDRQFVSVTLENISEVEIRNKNYKEQVEAQKKEQAELAKIFTLTEKKVETVNGDLSTNVYTTYIDRVHGIQRMDWNGSIGKYERMGVNK